MIEPVENESLICRRCDGSGLVCLNCMESEESCFCDDVDEDLAPCMNCDGEGELKVSQPRAAPTPRGRKQ